MTVAAIALMAAAVLICGGSTASRPRLRGLALGPAGASHAGPASTRPGRAGHVLVGVSVTICAAVLGPLVGGLVLATSLVVRAWAARARDHRRSAAVDASVPDAFRVLAAELLAGSLPADALGAAGWGQPAPLGDLLRAAAAAEQLGANAVSVLAASPVCGPAMRALSVCWEVSVGSGAVLARSVEQLAVLFGAELEARAVIEAELAGVRLSAAVMACLPILGLALGATLGSEPLQFLFGSVAGRGVLALAAVLDGLGLWWVAALGRKAAR